MSLSGHPPNERTFDKKKGENKQGKKKTYSYNNLKKERGDELIQSAAASGLLK
jgi:hypothetical protein